MEKIGMDVNFFYVLNFIATQKCTFVKIIVSISKDLTILCSKKNVILLFVKDVHGAICLN